MRLISGSIIIVAGCLINAPNGMAQDNSKCLELLQAHGYLSKAQRACDFPNYNRDMLAAAQSCYRDLPKSDADGAINGGANTFATFETTRGRQTTCKETLSSFPNFFGDPRFFDLERTALSLRTLLEQENYTEVYALALKLESEIAKRPQGKYQPVYATTLRALAIAQSQLGTINDSIQTLLKEIELEERLYGRESQALAQTLHNLALTYLHSGRAESAEPLFRRALSLHEKFSDQETVAGTTLSLASTLAALKRYAEAESLYKRALTKLNNTERNPSAAMIYENLARMAVDREDYASARQYFGNADAIYVAAGLATKPSYAGFLFSLGEAFLRAQNYTEAQDMFEQALRISEKTLGADHPKTAIILDKLSSAYLLQSLFVHTDSFRERLPRVLELRRQATQAKLRSSRANPSEAAGGSAEEDREAFGKHLDAFGQAKVFAVGDRTALDGEAFEIAQLANYSVAAHALRQMAVRLSKQNPRLESLIRQRQEKVSQRLALQNALSEAAASDDHQRASTLRTQHQTINGELDRLSDTIHRDFPSFSSISEPRPLSVRQVQQLLTPDEALILIVPSPLFIHVFAISKDRYQYYAPFNLPSDGQMVIDAETISTFRKGLGTQSTPANNFDLQLSFKVYQRIFSDLDEGIRSKRHYNIVPTGALTALPFHLLLTEAPRSAASTPEDFRNAAWIIENHAITIIPSVTSLEALRSISRTTQSRKPLIGFANPRFAKSPQKIAISGSRKLAYTEYWKGADVDRAALGRLLAPLPDTEVELREVAKSVGASNEALYFGEMASERVLKSLQLKDFKIVYFATHGLVAGDVKSVGEPALALTLPDRQDAIDDGLLTASEVSQLSLDADWVVLSACNTIAGDRPGAEALSGLARSFFYAGAKALLVTHWDVESDAATRLTTGAFRKLAENSSLSRSEAVRQSMLELLKDTTDERNSNPSVWGAFTVVGEGKLR